MKQAQQVAEWHRKFGVHITDTPSVPHLDRVILRDRILQEEVTELKEAMLSGDLVATADGITDVLYVALGTACECGLHNLVERIFDEVHRSNMSKLDEEGNPIVRKDGKILKSKLFSPPNLKNIING